MPDRISSSKWTGPYEAEFEQRRAGVFAHRIGQPFVTSDYDAIPPTVRGVIRLGWMLLISPIALCIGWLLVDAMTPDIMVHDNRAVLMIWGMAAVGLGAWQAASRSQSFIVLRRAILGIGILATVMASITYSYLGITAHAGAKASVPERSFELVRVKGHRNFRRTIIWHQRADGSTVEAFNRGRPLPYAQVCASVQRLDGRNGFSWVRVLERSRAPATGQLTWGISRADCFSNVPLSSLPR